MGKFSDYFSRRSSDRGEEDSNYDYYEDTHNENGDIPQGSGIFSENLLRIRFLRARTIIRRRAARVFPLFLRKTQTVVSRSNS